MDRLRLLKALKETLRICGVLAVFVGLAALMATVPKSAFVIVPLLMFGIIFIAQWAILKGKENEEPGTIKNLSEAEKGKTVFESDFAQVCVLVVVLVLAGIFITVVVSLVFDFIVK